MNRLTDKRIVATIEARMTSSRLPGKVLLESIGKPMLQLMVERLKGVKHIDDVVIATTVNATDDPIIDMAEQLGIKYFRGSEEDVLQRVLGAAHENNADIIVELTGDCPLIDPELIDQVIQLYFESDCDYATNCLPQTLPLGMEVEVYSTKLLELADREGQTQEDREHVSWYFIRNPDKFKQVNIEAAENVRRPDIRLTLDEEADYKVIDAVFSAFENNYKRCSCSDIIQFLESNPEILELNKKIKHRGDSEYIAKNAGVDL